MPQEPKNVEEPETNSSIQKGMGCPNQHEEKRERAVFVTIDDLCCQARILLDGLDKLAANKHPLAVRRGVTIRSGNGTRSKVLRAGNKTYFFDLKEARDKRPYLAITESRPHPSTHLRTRKRIIIFPEHAQAFARLVVKMTRELI